MEVHAKCCPYCGSKAITIIDFAPRKVQRHRPMFRRGLLRSRHYRHKGEVYRKREISAKKVGLAIMTAGLSTAVTGITEEMKDTYYCEDCGQTFEY